MCACVCTRLCVLGGRGRSVVLGGAEKTSAWLSSALGWGVCISRIELKHSFLMRQPGMLSPSKALPVERPFRQPRSRHYPGRQYTIRRANSLELGRDHIFFFWGGGCAMWPVGT